MKLTLFFLLMNASHAADLGREITAYQSAYRTAEHLQNMQIEKLSGLMDDIWKTSKEIESLPKNEHYTVKSAKLYEKLGDLSTSVRSTSQAFYQNNMRVRMNATEAEDIVSMRREAYFKKLENVAAMDKSGRNSLNLSKDILRDVDFVRATRDIPEAGRRQ